MIDTEKKNNEKREFKRFDTNIQASLFYGNMVYSGVITNLSKSGMFIRTKRHFPVDAMLMTTLQIDDESIQVPVRIKRAVSPVSSVGPEESGVGVHIIRSSTEYLNFLNEYSFRQLKLTL